MSTTKHDRAELNAALVGMLSSILDGAGCDPRLVGSEYRVQRCPECGERTRKDAVAVNAETGRWMCHVGSCKGDVFALVAGYAGLNPRTEFPAVLELAAKMTGVVSRSTNKPPALVFPIRRSKQEQIDKARADAAAMWGNLRSSDARGESYLTKRGLARVAKLCRYDRIGQPCVPLFDADGEMINVIRRCFSSVGPKVIGLKGCPAGTILGNPKHLGAGQVVVIAEGMIDTLTARAAWPDLEAFGAHGAGQIPNVVAAIAGACKESGITIRFVPDNDAAGLAHCMRGVKAAQEIGIAVEIVELPAKDLNDAWVAGWRP